MGESLHLIGSGNVSSHFSWTGPATDSPGLLNVNQIIIDGCSAGGDSDGDGVSDADETIAGTSSSDSNDFFEVRGILNTNGDLNITLPTKTNRNYVVQWTDNLADTNSWQDLDPAAMGSGGDDVFPDVAPTNDALFYRGDVRIP